MKLINLFVGIITALLLNACQTAATQPVVENKCTEPRPEICTMDYKPVCGVHQDQTVKTYSNGCSACSDPKVVGYNDGEC